MKLTATQEYDLNRLEELKDKVHNLIDELFSVTQKDPNNYKMPLTSLVAAEILGEPIFSRKERSQNLNSQIVKGFKGSIITFLNIPGNRDKFRRFQKSYKSINKTIDNKMLQLEDLKREFDGRINQIQGLANPSQDLQDEQAQLTQGKQEANELQVQIRRMKDTMKEVYDHVFRVNELTSKYSEDPGMLEMIGNGFRGLLKLVGKN